MNIESNLNKSQSDRQDELSRRLRKVRGQLEEREADKSAEIEAIDKKLQEIQSEKQQNTEDEMRPEGEAKMTEEEYQKKVQESDHVKSPQDAVFEKTEEVPVDVKERAKQVRQTLGKEIDGETAEQLWEDLDESEKERLKGHISEADERKDTNEGKPREAFIDVGTDEVFSSLSDEERQIFNNHPKLFQKLNQEPDASNREYIVRKHAEKNDDTTYEEAQKVRQLVEDLKEQYS